MMYQFHIEDLKQGQMLQLRIVYNNSKVLSIIIKIFGIAIRTLYVSYVE